MDRGQKTSSFNQASRLNRAVVPAGMDQCGTAGTGLQLDRRQWLAGAGVLAGLALAKPVLAGVPERKSFRLLRKGSHVGQHEITFETRADGSIRATTNVELVVKIAFIVAYSYRQNADELWQDGALVQSKAHCVEDGEETAFFARREDDELKIDGHEGKVAVDLGAMTDISFWNRDIVSAKKLISTQFGKVAGLKVATARSEQITSRGELIEAERFDMDTELDKSGVIWYDRQNGDWVKGTLFSKGERIDYELEA